MSARTSRHAAALSSSAHARLRSARIVTSCHRQRGSRTCPGSDPGHVRRACPTQANGRGVADVFGIATRAIAENGDGWQAWQMFSVARDREEDERLLLA